MKAMMRDAVDDEEEEEHRDGKGEYQLGVTRQEQVEGRCPVEQGQTDNLLVRLPALFFGGDEKKCDAVKSKEHGRTRSRLMMALRPDR